MKIAVLITCFIIHGMVSRGQQLEGEWKGYFLPGNIEILKTEIFINFYKINDTTFEGYTKTVLKNDTAICILTGGFLKKNMLFLEETRMIKGFSGFNVINCMQIYKLYYREKKKSITLHGDWITSDKNCAGGGRGTIT